MMTLDVRIRYNGARVRLRGFGMRKLQNLRILVAGIESIKARLAQGRDQEDGPVTPLRPGYAKFKKRIGRQPIRDLRLTGELLDGIKPRFADENQALADASGRKGRLKARVHRELLLFSPQDQAVMSEVAADLFRENVNQVFGRLIPTVRRSRRPSSPEFSPVQFQRVTIAGLK